MAAFLGFASPLPTVVPFIHKHVQSQVIAPKGGSTSSAIESPSGNAGFAASLMVGAVALKRNRSRLRSLRAQSATTLEPQSQRRVALLGVIGLAVGFVGKQQEVSAIEAKEDEVLEVIDGDTVKLKNFGRVRFIGVDTPETVSPKQREEGKPPDCYGPEASAYTKNLLPKGTKVKVELDVEPTDRYGRTLGYLYKDNLFVNSELVKQGYARRLRVKPNVRYDELFVSLEKEAQTAKRGLWQGCKGPAAAATPATIIPSNGDASLANPGNTKNCKDFSTYEEAKVWFDKYFRLYGDVAKLDGDGDGQPCEGLKQKQKK